MTAARTSCSPDKERHYEAEDDAQMVIPSLTGLWKDSVKAVGEKDSEFLSDFLIIQDAQGRWHFIGIGGQDHVEDSFFHAVGDRIDSHLEYTTRVYSNGTYNEPEMVHMWAPFAIFRKEGDYALMFYHYQPDGKPSEMRILRSTDNTLMEWVPLDDPDLEKGCIAFTGDNCRDACIFYDENVGKYLMYYAGTGIRLRTSDDLIHWSDSVQVMGVPVGFSAAESPYVVKKGKMYYLFVSGFDYGRVAVYASEDYSSFGNPRSDILGEINGHAPEIVYTDGKYYIACAAINAWDGVSEYGEHFPGEHNMSGVYIQEMIFTKESEAKWLKLSPKLLPKASVPMRLIKDRPDYLWSFDTDLGENISGEEGGAIEGRFRVGGVQARGLLMDGQRYDLGHKNFSFAENWTVSFYVRMSELNGNYNVILSKGPKMAGHFEIYVSPQGTVSFYQNELGIHDTNGYVADDEWHHVIFTYDGHALKCYLDYDEIYSADVSASVRGNPAFPIVLGCLDAGGESVYYFSGTVDELAIYCRVIEIPEK